MILIIDAVSLFKRILFTPSFDEFDEPGKLVEHCLTKIYEIGGRVGGIGGVYIAWDSRRSIRKELDSDYKKTRKTDLDPYRVKVFYEHLNIAREVLGKIGIMSFEIDGLEADDVIALIVNHKSIKDKNKMIVSSDGDLYQLLSDKVSMYKVNKNEIYTEGDFIEEYGIEPRQWPLVKAIAGCKSDNVIGLNGIGEKKAIKIIKGDMEYDTKILDNILDKNLYLVELPLEFDLEKWEISFLGKSCIDRDMLFEYCRQYNIDKVSPEDWMHWL